MASPLAGWSDADLLRIVGSPAPVPLLNGGGPSGATYANMGDIGSLIQRRMAQQQLDQTGGVVGLTMRGGYNIPPAGTPNYAGIQAGGAGADRIYGNDFGDVEGKEQNALAMDRQWLLSLMELDQRERERQTRERDMAEQRANQRSANAASLAEQHNANLNRQNLESQKLSQDKAKTAQQYDEFTKGLDAKTQAQLEAQAAADAATENTGSTIASQLEALKGSYQQNAALTSKIQDHLSALQADAQKGLASGDFMMDKQTGLLKASSTNPDTADRMKVLASKLNQGLSQTQSDLAKQQQTMAVIAGQLQRLQGNAMTHGFYENPNGGGGVVHAPTGKVFGGQVKVRLPNGAVGYTSRSTLQKLSGGRG